MKSIFSVLLLVFSFSLWASNENENNLMDQFLADPMVSAEIEKVEMNHDVSCDDITITTHQGASNKPNKITLRSICRDEGKKIRLKMKADINSALDGNAFLITDIDVKVK